MSAPPTPPAPLQAPLPPPEPSDREEHPDEPLRGIILVLVATALFSVSDALGKTLTATLPPTEIVWLRWVGFTLIMLPVAARRRGAALRTRVPGLQLPRGVLILLSSAFFVAGLRTLPMASATTMSFVSPLLVTALSIPLLGERVGPRRWAAVLVGLGGVLIVVRPGTDSFDPAAVFPLLSALFWALSLIATRRIGGFDGPATTMIYSAITGLAVASGFLPFAFVPPGPREVALAGLMAAAATAGQFLLVNGYRFAAASVLAPLSYTQLIWSGLLGWLVFGGLVDRWTVLGAAVIIGSGVYTARRERAVRAAPARR